MVLNRVYRLLTANKDAEQREELDGELWAPVEGWDAAERRLWQHIDTAASEAAAGETGTGGG